MESQTRRNLVLWLVVATIALASLALGTYRLVGLPELDLTIGPDLQIRHVESARFSRADPPKFKRGDRFTALEGHRLERLSDLRMLMRNLKGDAGSASDSHRSFRYQILRPLHRFTLAVQGDELDPTSLPSGYNPRTDRLVKINGRALPDVVGPEGVRSITGSRDQVLLTFERHNAVFSGSWRVDPGGYEGVAIGFGLAFLFLLALWRFHSRQLHPWSSIAVGLETIAFAWTALLVLAYQWVIADPVVASCVVAGMVLVRPLAIFARAKDFVRGGATDGWWAIVVGTIFAGLLLGFLHTGLLDNLETGLYAAASITGLYIVYEVFLVAFDEGPHVTLREGGGYLAGILMVSMATATLAWNLDPVVFRETLWRWFAVVLVGLVWFGDVLFCLRGAAGEAYGDVVTVDERRETIEHYLESIADGLPQTRPFLVLKRGDAMVAMRRREEGVVFEPPGESIEDVVSILLREQTRIPLPETVERATHPLDGIAQTMDIVLALQLKPPSGGLQLPDAEVVLLAVEETDAGELPSYASSETIDLAQSQLTASTWGAIFVEGTSAIGARDAKGRDGSIEIADRTETPGSSEGRPSTDGDLEEARETIEMLRRDRRELAERVQSLSNRWRHVGTPVEDRRDLLETPLVDDLDAMLDSDAPLVYSGPFGAGKAFTARCAHQLDGGSPEGFALYDPSVDAHDRRRTVLLGDDGPEEGFVETARHGALLVRSAGLLSDETILALCEAAEARDFRLHLTFQTPDPGAHSPMDARGDDVRERLQRREILIPPFRMRETIRDDVFDFYLERYSSIRDLAPRELNEDALEALGAYEWPGELYEVRGVLNAAVARASSETIRCEDLPGEWTSNESEIGDAPLEAGVETDGETESPRD
jgi:hypothetical protein